MTNWDNPIEGLYDQALTARGPVVEIATESTAQGVKAAAGSCQGEGRSDPTDVGGAAKPPSVVRCEIRGRRTPARSNRICPNLQGHRCQAGAGSEETSIGTGLSCGTAQCNVLRDNPSWEHIINDASIATRENIARRCVACNSSKGTKNLTDWLALKYCKARDIGRESIALVARSALDSNGKFK